MPAFLAPVCGRDTLTVLTLAVMIQASHAAAQQNTAPSVSSPAYVLPALAATVTDPGDGRHWAMATQIDPSSITITATTAGGAIAVSLQRPRRIQLGCTALMVQLFRTRALEPFRTTSPVVFRGAPWEPRVFRQHSDTHDGEFGCIRIGTDTWLASAIARSHEGVTLRDAAPMAAQLSIALLSGAIRRDYPVRLTLSGLDLPDPGDDVPWLYLGPAVGFPIPSDAVSSGAGGPGGVTLTVARRAGDCTTAWNALRTRLTHEGTLVDRPGYVPAVFGPRIRRIVLGERMREIYCTVTPAGALLITAMFHGDDGEAMSRMAPMLRALVNAAAAPRPSP